MIGWLRRLFGKHDCQASGHWWRLPPYRAWTGAVGRDTTAAKVHVPCQKCGMQMVLTAESCGEVKS